MIVSADKLFKYVAILLEFVSELWVSYIFLSFTLKYESRITKLKPLEFVKIIYSPFIKNFACLLIEFPPKLSTYKLFLHSKYFR